MALKWIQKVLSPERSLWEISFLVSPEAFFPTPYFPSAAARSIWMPSPLAIRKRSSGG